MSYSAKTKHDGQTDRQTLQYLPSRAFGAVGDKNVEINAPDEELAGTCRNLNIHHHKAAVLTLATRMFVINEKLFLFAIVDRYPFATCVKDIFVTNSSI